MPNAHIEDYLGLPFDVLRANIKTAIFDYHLPYRDCLLHLPSKRPHNLLEMSFPWKRLFPDISYLRTKRSRRSDQTQSTWGDIDGDESAPPGITNDCPGLTTPDLSSSLFQQRVPIPSGYSLHCAQSPMSLRQSCLGWQPLQGSFQLPVVHYKLLSVDCCSSFRV